MEYNEVVRDFASRTQENLLAIEKLKQSGHEVFETTQLINSMLGLLVFPQQAYVDTIPETPIEELKQMGWPIPREHPRYTQVTNLKQLIRYMRNAVAHFNIEFIADRQHTIQKIRVWNTRMESRAALGTTGRMLHRNWEAELNIEELRTITMKFIDLMREL